MDDGVVINFHFLHIFGEFENSRGETQKQFLGFSFRKALGVCDLVKGSFHRRRFEARLIGF